MLRDRRLWFFIIAPGVLSACAQETEQGFVPAEVAAAIDKSNPNWKQQLGKPEVMNFKPGEKYFWKMETNMGNMSFLLFHDLTPMHVSSTIYLTELGFYDGVLFHRVIPGFMAQGGDPAGTGRGGPGYKYDGEFPAGLSHDRAGLLSMANAGPGTDGSQFFITFVPTQYLDGKHTIFGELVDGMETLKALEERGSNSGRTVEELKIIKATIRRESIQ
jgi:cyclophilin family peptidyl-prolyl cis-trans isomerase